MDPSLVNELAARLGTSTMEARIALADLLQEAREDLEDHGAAQLPGLGTFRREENAPSRLTFQPEALLEDAANHAFAGLDALTVPDPSADAKEAPEASPSEPASELPAPEHIAAEPERAAELSPTGPPPAEPDEHAPPEPASAESPSDASANRSSIEEAPPEEAARCYEADALHEADAPEPPSSEPDASEPDAAAPPPHADDESVPNASAPPARTAPEPPAPETPAPLPIQKVDWESVLQDTPYAVMPAAGYLRGGPTRAALEAASLEAPPAQPPVEHVPDHPPTTRRRVRRRAPALPWIAAALVLAALAAGLWYVMQPGERAEPSSPPTAEEEAAPVTSPSPGAAADAAPTPDTATASPAEEAPAHENPAVEEPAEEPLAPVLDPAPGDWTAVAASRPTRVEADVLARQYRVQLGAAGVPVGVIAGEVDGSQFFRVAVGRFASFEETQTFLQRTDSPLPGDAWALQIEP